MITSLSSRKTPLEALKIWRIVSVWTGSRFLLTFDNHILNGIREFARAKGATVAYSPLFLPSLTSIWIASKHWWT